MNPAADEMLLIDSQWAEPTFENDPASEEATRLGIEYITDLPQRTPSAEFVKAVPIGFARRHGLLGIAADEAHGPLRVAMADVGHVEALHVVGRFLRRHVRPVLAPAADIAASINAAYQQRTGQAQSFIDKLESPARDDVLQAVRDLGNREDLLDVASRAPVIQLVNLMLFEAVQARASDVHIQPYEETLVIRMRIDGVLYDLFSLPKSLQEEIVSRVKIMGRMNIAEKRLAQDGRATVQVGDRVIDLRIASLPTSFGERVVVRLLDKSARLYSLGEVGMEPDDMERFRRLISMEHGIILVTGPTGSGKTTTLYAALREIDSTERNILTLEDPIEYQLDGISQTQVSDKKGMTFAGGLRSVLRQDPDIIMVGEIRDHETAVMAIQSALTGHLVFSTLHTNDAASAITRLLDLGIEPYLLGSSLVGVLAQRLVRRICPRCGEVFQPSTEHLDGLGLEAAHVQPAATRRGAGCAACRQTGYSGRLGIFELLVVNEPIRREIAARATASRIKTAAVESGMRTLRDDGVAKVLAGKTTVDETIRVTMRAEL
jgi:general secretion pathway protein E